MTDEELNVLLQKNLETSQESLKILKKINRGRLVGNFFSFLKWVVIIGATVGAFYYLQPYIDKIPSLLNEIQNIQKLMPK
ncbi:MAG: hypothetical protein NTX55_00600 [Candidatus Parcubacteria bacterium]|nr:hypothetical protein [Candidatus Parcubacteria bacterium]